MSEYSRRVGYAKDRVTRTLVCLAGKDPEERAAAAEELAQDIDELNKAWDALTDSLVRQREERGYEVLRLLDALAEQKGRRA